MALLNANLQTEQNIYLNSSQAQKVTAATDALIDYLPAQVLIHAFPTNSNYGYNSAGLPFAPPLPQSVANALDAVGGGTQPGALKFYFGLPYNVYGNAYNAPSADSNGDPRPFQVSSLISGNPFTPANSSSLAYQIQQQSGFGQNWQSYTGSPSFPSGHSTAGNTEAIFSAILAPGYYQQLVQAGVDYGLSRNMFGVHYPLDVIAGRIIATYVIAQTLNGSPLYNSGIPGNLAPLSQAMQAYLGGGAASPYAAPCAGNVAACVANGVIPSATTYTQALKNYTALLTYGLPPVGDQTLPPFVPPGAFWLIATRFPYLDQTQLVTILATTELPSGGALDPGTGLYAGWARLNLYAAAGGFAVFPVNETVAMNAALGGLNAFDIWSNNIVGPGGLTLQGSGTLILAGNDLYTGGTNVQGGTLAVTGTLGGNLAISPGATFISNGGYSVASNASLMNAGTFIEVNAPLVTAGSTTNTGLIVGDVNNSGNFINNAVVTGAFTNTGQLSGNGIVGSLALLSGSTVAPGNSVGTIQVLGNLTVAAGATYQAQVGTGVADVIQVGGTATLSGGTVVATSIGSAPAIGSSYPILTATGGITGSFGNLTEPTSGLAAGTRFDTLYGSNTISLVVTPSFYGNLAAAGIAESGSESSVGSALDAIRPAPGVAMNAAQSTLFGPLYTLPANSIATALDELAPSLYADGLITARNSWYLMADSVGAQLAARRGLAPDKTANGVPGPNGSTIWASGLAGYYGTGAGGGSPGFTAGLGGAAVGIDMPVFGTGLVGAAIGSVDGQTWSQTGGRATSTTAQLVAYGQWRGGIFFADAQFGTMYLQENVRRSLPIFATSTQGSTDGLAGGGGVRFGVQQVLDAWLIEPSIGFGGFGFHQDSLAETGTALTENIGGASLGSAESTLAVSAQRSIAVSDTVQMVAKGRLGWSHEFASNTGSISASFTGLSGSGFQLSSAPIGRDAALVGLGADFKVANCPLAMFVSYNGAISGSSNAQAFNAGLRFTW